MTPEQKDWFRFGESPYFAMFRAGLAGIPFNELSAHLVSLCIPIREKDIRSYEEGRFKSCVHTKSFDPVLPSRFPSKKRAIDEPFESLPMFVNGWNGCDRRWFPCSQDNLPMQKWGYSASYTPELYTRSHAVAMSPCGFVGQNMYMQPFVVLDIDGVGHGVRDEQVIEFGRRYSNKTECWESPDKPGSFHLYFKTRRVVPVMHFPFAKLDVMGNSVNAAVYTKRKESNLLPRMELTPQVWQDIRAYVTRREEERKCRSTI